MNRRGFLRTTAGLGAAAGAWGLTRQARAEGFGEAPGEAQRKKLLGPGVAAESVLECYLYGGLSQWETFYCVEEFGRPDNPDPELRNSQFYAFFNDKNQKMLDALGTCGMTGPFTMPGMAVPFARDANNVQVNLGPYLQPLLARKDVVGRMRVVVNRHDLEPHEAAIPFALCGKRLGTPSMASLGAHVQRYFRDRAGRVEPYSYVFSTKALPIENVRASTATGLHPGSSRPLLIKVDSAAKLAELLGRPGLAGGNGKHDALVRALSEGYQGRLRFRGEGDPLRSPRVRELEQAALALEGAPEIAALLPSSLFSPIMGQSCGAETVNNPALSLKLAAHLLTHPGASARYCCFIDGGLTPADAGGGYDTHIEAPLTQARNIRNTMTSLLSVINEPGEKDPSKIDLDRTMIVFNMDFGRSPRPQGALGRNHWPYGYVQVYIGGPIGAEQSGIYGAIGPDGRATLATTPPENRIACLLALGIWPFSADGFGVSDVQGASGEIDAVERVSASVLGRAV